MSTRQNNNPPPPTFGMQWLTAAGVLTQAAFSFLAGLYNRPNYVDMAWFMPGVLVAATQPVFRYQCPPDVQVRPFYFYAALATAPTVSNATLSVWRSGLPATASMPAIPGGKLADITVFAGANVGLTTIYPDQSFTAPGAELFVTINTVGAGVAGADLFLLIRA